jgi:hypothetical protein
MIKYTRDEQERLHLQEALRVMLSILSNLNDVMHSTQIIGYSVCSKIFFFLLTYSSLLRRI